MKLKNTLLASALLSATAFSVNAATELTPEQAAAVKPFVLSTLLILVTAVTGVWSLTSIKPMLKKQKKQVIA